MEQVTFTITKEEIQQYSEEQLTEEQFTRVLETIECDETLWDYIKETIISAIKHVCSQSLKDI
jgi:hypothetical protein